MADPHFKFTTTISGRISGTDSLVLQKNMHPPDHEL